MKTKHTPGPWTLNKRKFGREHTIRDAKGDLLAFTENFLLAKPWEEIDANARLIAAAPELLEALANVLNQADAQFKAGDRCATFNKQTIESFRAAISKATLP